MISINGKPIDAKEFGWDECHKIYLINSEKDKAQLKEYGYALFPIDELDEIWENSCPLKFICDGDLKYSPVEQGQQAIIKEI